MKHNFTVTITKDIEIDIPDENLTLEYLQFFSSHFHYLENTQALLEYVAQYVARLEDNFVEGVGNVEYKVLDEYVEVEDLRD